MAESLFLEGFIGVCSVTILMKEIQNGADRKIECVHGVKDLMLLLQRLQRMSQELYTHIVMHILGI